MDDEMDYGEFSCYETSSCYENASGESIVTKVVIDTEDLRRLRARNLDDAPEDAVVAIRWE